jgi:hypothetical protein
VIAHAHTVAVWPERTSKLSSVPAASATPSALAGARSAAGGRSFGASVGGGGAAGDAERRGSDGRGVVHALAAEGFAGVCLRTIASWRSAPACARAHWRV